MGSYHKHRLTAAQQLFMLKRTAICRGDGALHHHRLIWEFPVTPSPLSRTYRVKIEHEELSTPKVFVIDPDLHVLADGRKLPHIYASHPPRLCLYLPGTKEWSSELLIAMTIVPWTYMWLFYFEEWLLSNDWKGGGEHPESNDDE